MRRRRLPWLLIIFVMVFQLNVQAAAVPMPILPYVPPSKVQLYDLLNNVYGLTRLNISDDAKRLAAYVDLYTRIMGAANAEIIDRMLDSSYSNRKYVIKAELMNGVQSVMNTQVVTGYEEVITATPANVQETYNKLLTWQYINSTKLSYTQFQSMYTTAQNALGSNILVLCTYITKGVDNTLVIGFVKNEGNYTFHTGYQSVGSFNGLSTAWKKNSSNTAYQCIVYGQNLGGSWSRGNNNNSPWFGFENTCVATSIQYGSSGFSAYNFTTKGESYMRKASVQDAAISTALTNSTDIPVTADSVVNNGVLDTTKDVVISLPAILPVPASNVNDLEDVQDDLGVVPLPLTQDVAATVTDLQGTQAAQLGDTSTYAIDLTEYFPFCIPFDIGNLLTLFVADPEAPTFTFQLPVGYDTDDGFLWETYTLDLSQFDQVALWCRRGMLLIFIVGLGLSTRQVFLRG